jgi:membrane protein DedA with SNARE-associated domain
MSGRRFLIANVTSALIWAPAHVFPAQLAGLSIDRLRDGDWMSAAWLGAIVVVCGIAVWLVHRRLTPLVLAARRAEP